MSLGFGHVGKQERGPAVSKNKDSTMQTRGELSWDHLTLVSCKGVDSGEGYGVTNSGEPW